MGNDYIIPLYCPFTGTVIFNNDGYHEPFPSTLIMYSVEEPVFQLKGLEVLKEINQYLDDIGSFIPRKAQQKLFLKNLKIRFPWLKTSKNSDVSTLNHPLIVTVFDKNKYGGMCEGLAVFYFALPTNHKNILRDFSELLAYLVNKLDKLEDEK